MKPEPLIGKRYHSIYTHYKEEDVKAAVEWLKQKLIEYGHNEEGIFNIIDDAFGDAIHKGIEYEGEYYEQ